MEVGALVRHTAPASSGRVARWGSRRASLRSRRQPAWRGLLGHRPAGRSLRRTAPRQWAHPGRRPPRYGPVDALEHRRVHRGALAGARQPGGHGDRPCDGAHRCLGAHARRGGATGIGSFRLRSASRSWRRLHAKCGSSHWQPLARRRSSGRAGAHARRRPGDSRRPVAAARPAIDPRDHHAAVVPGPSPSVGGEPGTADRSRRRPRCGSRSGRRRRAPGSRSRERGSPAGRPHGDGWFAFEWSPSADHGASWWRPVRRWATPRVATAAGDGRARRGAACPNHRAGTDLAFGTPTASVDLALDATDAEGLQCRAAHLRAHVGIGRVVRVRRGPGAGRGGAARARATGAAARACCCQRCARRRRLAGLSRDGARLRTRRRTGCRRSPSRSTSASGWSLPAPASPCPTRTADTRSASRWSSSRPSGCRPSAARHAADELGRADPVARDGAAHGASPKSCSSAAAKSRTRSRRPRSRDELQEGRLENAGRAEMLRAINEMSQRRGAAERRRHRARRWSPSARRWTPCSAPSIAGATSCAPWPSGPASTPPGGSAAIAADAQSHARAAQNRDAGRPPSAALAGADLAVRRRATVNRRPPALLARLAQFDPAPSRVAADGGDAGERASPDDSVGRPQRAAMARLAASAREQTAPSTAPAPGRCSELQGGGRTKSAGREAAMRLAGLLRLTAIGDCADVLARSASDDRAAAAISVDAAVVLVAASTACRLPMARRHIAGAARDRDGLDDLSDSWAPMATSASTR